MDAGQPRPEDRHLPVMRDRVVDLLAPAVQAALEAGRTPVAVDGTLGMGGHTEALLTRFPHLRVIGIDRDVHAQAMAVERLGPLAERLIPFHGTYDRVPEAMAAAGVTKVDAALYDLGVSSYQLDDRERGFAYSYDAPLDMRMDDTAERSAATLVAELDEQELRRIIRRDGEERFAGPIARAIVRARDEAPIETTGRLVEVIRSAVPVAAGATGGHPAKRTFQALRIEVNDELRGWEQAVTSALDSLAVGGRLAVLSFHSLEDRITKRAFATASASTAPPGLPVELPEHRPEFALVARGAAVPSEDELARNPRSASVRLRVIERTRAKGSQS